MKVDDTYWKQIIDITETRLLVNNAWSGSSIAKQGGAKRGVQLHDNYGYYNGETPDIILVHYGTNDYLSFVSQGDEAYGVESFAASYDEMVAAMLETYEDVDIYLFTFPHYKTNEDHIAIQQEYNDVIRATAEKYRCPLVDLHNNSAFNLETFKELTVDGLHPNKAGMDAITDTLYNVMCEQYIK